VREFAIAQFVEDLAWFGIAVWLVFLSLQRAQDLQRATRELRVDKHILQRNEETISTKWSDEPRQSSRGHENHVVGAFDRQAERGHILERLMKEAIKLFVARPDFRYPVQPFRHCRMLVRFVPVLDTAVWCVKRLLAVFQAIEQTGVPNLVRLKHDLKTEPAVGRDSLARSTRN